MALLSVRTGKSFKDGTTIRKSITKVNIQKICKTLCYSVVFFECSSHANINSSCGQIIVFVDVRTARAEARTAVLTQTVVMPCTEHSANQRTEGRKIQRRK